MQEQICLYVLKPDHLGFFLSRCRKSDDENNGSICFFCPLSVLISVHCCHSSCCVVFIYNISYSYLYFLQGIKQTHGRDRFIVSKHLSEARGKRDGGGEKEGGRGRFSIQGCLVICPLLEIFKQRNKKKKEKRPPS